MKKLAIVIGLAVLLVGAAPAQANGIPKLPHAFYGSVAINGSPAPVGTTVEATGEGVVTGIEGNPVTTTVAGIYGTANPFEPRLIVQGNIEEGATITFYVNGESTGQTAAWHEGESTQLDLSVTIAVPPAPPPAAGGPAPIYVTMDLFGVEGSYSISSEGIIQETITATSPDGKFTITLPKGTKALDKDGKPLSTLTVDIDPEPPAPPEGEYIILPYVLGPEGATFDPYIILTWNYADSDIPADAEEGSLKPVFYDGTKWVVVEDYDIDTATNTITARVTHFTTFTMVAAVRPAAPAAPPAAPAPEEEEEEVVPAEEEVAPPEEEVVPPPEEEVVPPGEVNWPLIGGVIGAVVIVAIVVILLVVRRRAY